MAKNGNGYPRTLHDHEILCEKRYAQVKYWLIGLTTLLVMDILGLDLSPYTKAILAILVT